jgi:hypothetical protein
VWPGGQAKARPGVVRGLDSNGFPLSIPVNISSIHHEIAVSKQVRAIFSENFRFSTISEHRASRPFQNIAKKRRQIPPQTAKNQVFRGLRGFDRNAGKEYNAGKIAFVT